MLKKLFAILFILVALPVFGQGERQYTINDFSKGQNSHTSEYNLQNNQGIEAENVRTNSVLSALANRPKMIQYGTTGSDSINGLYRYYKTDDTAQLIAASGTSLYLGAVATGVFTAIGSDLGDNEHWDFETYQDTLIGSNGYDNIIKYDGATTTTADTDGARTAGELITELGAPFAELATGTDLDASSWYQYKIAYYDGSNYQYSTARSNPILTGATVYNIALTDIPLGITGTTHRYIYRTLGNASKTAVEADTTYYLVGTIADNSTKTFSDTVDDATAAGDAAPTWATASGGTDATPPKGKYLEIHKERLWVSGNTNFNSYIYWSQPFKPQYFDSGDYEIIREDDGDKITNITEFLGLMTVFKTNSVMKFFTTNSSSASWTTSQPLSFVGCQSPYTMQVTPIGILYLNRGGIYNFNGQYSTLISDVVTDEIRDIRETSLAEATGIYFNNEYHLAYTSSSSGSSVNDRVLVYDVARDSYVKDIKNINSFTSFRAGDDFGVIYGGSSASDGKVWAFEESVQVLKKRYKSELDEGTYADAKSSNTEEQPYIEIAWIETIDEVVGTIDAQTGILDRPDTDGTWTSPVYLVNAQSFDSLTWNELLGSSGDVTWNLRTNSATDMSLVAWSSDYSDSLGSDISAVTADTYVQLKANLSTSDITTTPFVFSQDGFVFKVFYSKSGATQESGLLASWDSAWRDLFVGQEGEMYRKEIQRIRVFFKGTEGTLNINYKNEEGNVDNDISIDLSQASSEDIDGDGTLDYIVNGTTKIYYYYPPANYVDTPASIGSFFRFLVTAEDASDWEVDKIEIRFILVSFDD